MTRICTESLRRVVSRIGPAAFALACVLALALAPAEAQAGIGLWLDQNVVAPGAAVKVHFLAPASFAGNAWIGIVPSTVPHGSEATNDENDVTYQYLESKTSGDLTFTVPTAPGAYDFRMNDTDGNGKEVAFVSFAVAWQTGPATLRIDKTTFAPGEAIRVRFTAPSSFAKNAWVGIIPSSVAHGTEAVNDQNDLTYQYLEGRTSGDLAFQAPAAPGAYDFRMNDTDDNGKEAASVSFTVK